MSWRNLSKFLLVIVITAILSYLAVYGFRVPWTNYKIPSVKDMRTGIDIRGGIRATLSAPTGVRPSQQEIDTVRAIIETRLNNEGIFDRTVAPELNTGKIIVEIPWKSGETNFDPQAAIEELGKTALLTFREVDETKVDQNGNYLPVGQKVIEGMDVKNATPQLDNEGKMAVALDLTKEAGLKFEQATGRLVGKKIGIFMDNTLISAPQVSSKIPAGNKAVITLNSSGASASAEAKNLADTIRAGALPFKLETQEVNSISPMLGENALAVTVNAGIVALILVWIFMFIYYRLPGIIANIALLAHTAIQLLVLAAMGITITLPGIAGIILTIGMGVDANVIIFERIKEELRKKKGLHVAIDIGFKRGFAAILDANMTTLISAIVLYIFGSGPIQSFAITLGIGVALSFLTAVTASRIMLKSVAHANIAKHPRLYGL